VHFGGISLAREPLAGKLVALAQELKAAGVKISYDPNFRLMMDERYDATLRRMTELADVVKVSEEDLAGLFRTTISTRIRHPARLEPAGHLFVLARRAGRGPVSGRAVMAGGAAAIEVVDSVGAGDASIGGLLYSLMYRPTRTGRALALRRGGRGGRLPGRRRLAAVRGAGGVAGGAHGGALAAVVQRSARRV
jgi:fructokinase